MRLRSVVAWTANNLGIERTSKRRLRRAARLARGSPNTIVRARMYEAALANGGSYAEIALHFGVTREKVCHYVTLGRRLPPDLVHRVEQERAPEALRRLCLGRLLPVARMPPPRDQREAINRL